MYESFLKAAICGVKKKREKGRKEEKIKWNDSFLTLTMRVIHSISTEKRNTSGKIPVMLKENPSSPKPSVVSVPFTFSSSLFS